MRTVTIFFSLWIFSASSAQGAASINVLAASSTQEVMESMAKAFQGKYGIQVRTSFAASSVLAKQVLAGVNADIFISASPDWMNKLQESDKLVASSRRKVAGNRLVLVALSENAAACADLKASSVRKLALGDPDHVPAGMYAKKALTQLKLWEGVQKKILPAVDVRAALAYVERGEATCGIVYRTDASISKKISVVQTFPDTSHPPIVYPAAILAASQQRSLGWGFMDFLSSKEGQALFKRHGFLSSEGK